jgi:hypothetical protein
MWRYLAGGVAALLMIAAGWLFMGSARTQPVLPPAPDRAVSADGDAAAPLPDRVPEASAKTREEKRFSRYDKDRDGLVAREEYLASRRKAFAKLDANGDGRLTFDEWAVKTTAKFTGADKDRSGGLTPAEFATTAVKRTARPRCVCPPVAAED